MAWLELPAGHESFPPLRDHILTRGAGLSLSVEMLARIELVLEEMLVNVIEYAYPQPTRTGPGPVRVGCGLDDQGRFLLVIEDHGPAFNPLERPSPDVLASMDERQVGGLGIFLAQEMADALSYQRADDRNSLMAAFSPRLPVS
ncbi:ATP-binding protein [Desulfocurvibacter africanus]|uniref:ATP-binding protein n=1 Tax=Desulfocurvibacter africanus TaxID=873 RepID=UPI00040B3F7E|nr:ATP-binding protein [Desulfocurvibacter africanus]